MGSRVWVQGLELRVWVQGLELRVWVEGLGFRISGFRCSDDDPANPLPTAGSPGTAFLATSGGPPAAGFEGVGFRV